MWPWAARAWAQLNPEAYQRGALSRADVLAARMVSDPLSVRDCCLVTDGAGAFVLTRADLAARSPKKAGVCAGQRNRRVEPADFVDA